MLYACGIVAHESREAMATELAEKVNPALVSIDSGRLGCDSNHRFVWEQLQKESTEWSVLLEDDAVPVEGFTKCLNKALEAAPAPIVGLYLGQQRPPAYQDLIAKALHKADAEGAHWITSRVLLHAVGVAIRTDLLPDMLGNLRPLPIDQAISRWAKRNQHQIAYAVPSLVDHHDGPTLFVHPDQVPRIPGRVAWRTGSRFSYNSRSVELGDPPIRLKDQGHDMAQRWIRQQVQLQDQANSH